MGSGSYDFGARAARAASSGYTTKSREHVFTQKSVHDLMNPKGVIRECRDNADHPNSFPIMLFCDVTGSMGYIPFELIKTGLPTIMGKVLAAGFADATICIGAVGDHKKDRGPLQVGQFECSDALIDSWLEKIWIEEGGGGNEIKTLFLAYAAR